MKSACSDRVRLPARLPFWLLPSLLGGLALAASVPAVSAQTQTISEIQITPETMTLGVGQKQALFAAAFDGRGNLLAAAKFTFWSSDTMIARVRKDGTVLGITPGLAKIEARTQGKRASMAVLITGAAPGAAPGARAPSASLLSLEPASVTLFPGENVRVTPLAVREDGNAIAVGRVTWKSLKPEIASVDTAGIVTGLGPGRTVVQVITSSRLMATLPVEVSQPDFLLSHSRLVLSPGESDTVRAIVPTQGNRQIGGLLRWRSTDSTVVSVGASGIARGLAPGHADIIAAGFSQDRRVAVIVHQLPEALVVSPQHSSGAIQVPLRATRRFTAGAEAADSSLIPEAKITWHLSDTSVAAFDPVSGVLRSKTLGTTTLTARLAGITPAVWTVQIVPGDIELQPTRVGIVTGRRTTLSVFLRDEQGAAAGRATGVRWSSDKPDIALAREGGVIDALSPGRAVVTASTSWGKSAKADVFVVSDLLLSSNRGGSFGIYQMRASGSPTLHPLLQDSAANVQPALAPDRTRVAFSSNRSGSFDLYLTEVDGKNLRRLTTAAGNEGDPAWTPDGAEIVYTSTSGTSTQIAIMPAEGGEARPLTTTAGGNHSPAVSPDGRSIAFVSVRDGNQEIYAMNLDGTNQRRLTRTSERESSPRFFRNGDLAYAVERGGRSRGSRVMRLAWGGTNATSLLQTEEPVRAIAVSRDGDRLAYVVGRLTDAAKGRVEFSFFLQSTAPGSAPVSVPLTPGEQILNPSF